MNAEEYVAKCLEAMERLTIEDGDVIVIDNVDPIKGYAAINEGLQAALKQRGYKKVLLLFLEEREGLKKMRAVDMRKYGWVRAKKRKKKKRGEP